MLNCHIQIRIASEPPTTTRNMWRRSDHDKYRRVLHERSIPTSIARRGHPHGSGLGKVHWVVEHTHAWLHHFRRLRLRIRFKRRADIHKAFSNSAVA